MRNQVDRIIDINWLWSNQYLPSHYAGRYFGTDIKTREELVNTLAHYISLVVGEDYLGKPEPSRKVRRLREIHEVEVYELRELRLGRIPYAHYHEGTHD